MELLVVERPELPKVAVPLGVRAGAVADPPGKEGLAHLTLVNIDMGTKTRKALEIEDALGDLGTSLAGSAGREAAVLWLRGPEGGTSPRRSTSWPTSSRTRSSPRASSPARRSVTSTTSRSRRRTRNALAARDRPMVAFGREHPYGRPVRRLPSTVERITRDDLVAFHRARWTPGGAALVMVGDVTLDEAKAIAEKAFAGWKGAAPPKVAIPAPAPMPAGKIYLVDRPDAAQTVISQVLPAPKRGTPDYDALRLADAVYGGGGFGTRLNLNLREDKRYSYGVFSNLALLSEAGSWTGGGGVQTDKTKESVVEFDKELRDLAGTRPISDKEFADAKATRTRGYSQGFETFGADLPAGLRPLGRGHPDGRAPARVRRRARRDPRGGPRRGDEVRRPGKGRSRPRRRPGEDRGGGEVARPRRGRPAGRRGETGELISSRGRVSWRAPVHPLLRYASSA